MQSHMEQLRKTNFDETHDKLKEFEDFDDPKCLKLIYEYNA